MVSAFATYSSSPVRGSRPGGQGASRSCRTAVSKPPRAIRTSVARTRARALASASPRRSAAARMAWILLAACSSFCSRISRSTSAQGSRDALCFGAAAAAGAGGAAVAAIPPVEAPVAAPPPRSRAQPRMANMEVRRRHLARILDASGRMPIWTGPEAAEFPEVSETGQGQEQGAALSPSARGTARVFLGSVTYLSTRMESE